MPSQLSRFQSTQLLISHQIFQKDNGVQLLNEVANSSAVVLNIVELFSVYLIHLGESSITSNKMVYSSSFTSNARTLSKVIDENVVVWTKTNNRRFRELEGKMVYRKTRGGAKTAIERYTYFSLNPRFYKPR